MPPPLSRRLRSIFTVDAWRRFEVINKAHTQDVPDTIKEILVIPSFAHTQSHR